MKQLIPNRRQARAAVAVAATALVFGLVPFAGVTPAAVASSCGAWATKGHDSLPDHGYDVDLYLKVRKCTSDSGTVSYRFTSVVCNRQATGKTEWTAQLIRNGEIVWRSYMFAFPSAGDCRVLNSAGEWAGRNDVVKATLAIEYAGQYDEADYLNTGSYTTPW